MLSRTNFLRIYYLILLYLLIPGLFKVLSATINGIEIAPPAETIEILSWVPLNYFGVFRNVVSFIIFLTLLSCVINPWRRISRALVPLGLLFWIGFASSYGKIIHGYQGWLFSSIAFTFLSYRSFAQTIHIAQFCSILCYASAGFWKIWRGFTIIKLYGFAAYSTSLGNAIAHEHGFNNYEASPLIHFLISNDWFLAVSFFLLILLQLTAPILTFISKTHVWIGVAFVIFHAASEVILKISFREQMYLMIILFVIPTIVRLGSLHKKIDFGPESNHS
jgi:hypothetical protein